MIGKYIDISSFSLQFRFNEEGYNIMIPENRTDKTAKIS